MEYNVKELRGHLKEKISNLGISPQFKSNPAFLAYLEQVESLILQMGMMADMKKVRVKEESGTISFEWTPKSGDKYSMVISCPNPNTIKCVRVEGKAPYLGTNGQMIKEGNIIEEEATIDKAGFMTLTTNGALLDNIECKNGRCNNTTWSERKYYTSKGVMRDREYKGFSRGPLDEDFDSVRISSALFIPRNAFDGGMWSDKYSTRTTLVRDKLDTARIYSEDRKKGIKYGTVVPLNQEHGLRDMSLLGGYDAYPQDIVIRPISNDEIEKMIRREDDPRVAEGLREYAEGRENYYYNSATDDGFTIQGIPDKRRKK